MSSRRRFYGWRDLLSACCASCVRKTQHICPANLWRERNERTRELKPGLCTNPVEIILKAYYTKYQGLAFLQLVSIRTYTSVYTHAQCCSTRRHAAREMIAKNNLTSCTSAKTKEQRRPAHEFRDDEIHSFEFVDSRRRDSCGDFWSYINNM